MIYTITFNPSLDYILNVKDFADGVVNRTSRDKYLPGGKGINVSTVLSDFGVETKALGFVGGFVGDEIERLLNLRGIKSDFVRLEGGVSRINVKIKSNSETEVNAQGPDITDKHIKELYVKLDTMKDGDILVMAGSVPQGADKNIYRDIMMHLGKRRIKFVVDGEGDLLRNTLSSKPFLIKPNKYELSEMFCKEPCSIDEIINCAEILRSEGAQNVLVSMGSEGAVLVSADGKRYYSQAPKGLLVNSTGAGDSSVAGFLYGYDKYRDYKKAFAYALCSGSACAFSENLASLNEAEEILIRQNVYEKIKLK